MSILHGFLYAATIDKYVGNWAGSGHYYDKPGTCDNDSFAEDVEMKLSRVGNELVGSVGIVGGTPISIQGTVVNGIFTFPFPSDTPQHPDCANWDVTGRAFLDSTEKTMSLFAEGMFCGDGGGTRGIFSGILLKTHGSTAPIMLLLDEKSNIGHEKQF